MKLNFFKKKTIISSWNSWPESFDQNVKYEKISKLNFYQTKYWMMKLKKNQLHKRIQKKKEQLKAKKDLSPPELTCQTHGSSNEIEIT
jgi:hypothetical protein